jgi:hypothetical protein
MSITITCKMTLQENGDVVLRHEVEGADLDAVGLFGFPGRVVDVKEVNAIMAALPSFVIERYRLLHETAAAATAAAVKAAREKSAKK